MVRLPVFMVNFSPSTSRLVNCTSTSVICLPSRDCTARASHLPWKSLISFLTASSAGWAAKHVAALKNRQVARSIRGLLELWLEMPRMDSRADESMRGVPKKRGSRRQPLPRMSKLLVQPQTQRRDVCARSYSCTTCRAFALMRRTSSSSANSRPSAAASISGACGGTSKPVCSGRTRSARPGMSVASIGRPDANPSSTTRPNASHWRDGTTPKRAFCNRYALAGPVTVPVNLTRSVRSSWLVSTSRAARSSPSPTITSCTCPFAGVRANACSSTSTPLRYFSRPRNIA